jgi:transposase
MGEQYVGIDLHRRRSVIVRMTGQGEVLETVRIDNDPVALSLELAKAGPDPEVVLEATYGWSWAADLLQACGATVHLAHPLGSRCSATSGPETDARDAANLGDLLRMGRLPEAWLAPPAVRGCASWCPTGPSWWRCPAASRPRSTRCWPTRGAGADERPVRGGRHPAAGGAAACAPMGCGSPRSVSCWAPLTSRSRCLAARSARPWPATSATWRSRPSLGWARCWRRSWWPSSARFIVSLARRSCAPGRG